MFPPVQALANAAALLTSCLHLNRRPCRSLARWDRAEMSFNIFTAPTGAGGFDFVVVTCMWGFGIGTTTEARIFGPAVLLEAPLEAAQH